MKKNVMRVGLAVLLATGAGVGVVGSVSAHTPDHGADCKGVWGEGRSYEKGDTLTVTLDGETASDTAKRDGALSASLPVPEDFEVHSWSVVFDSRDDRYDASWSGEVGPCAEKPDQPEAEVQTRPFSTDDCETLTVSEGTESRSREYVWDGDSWEPGDWTQWSIVADSVTERDMTSDEAKACSQQPEPTVEVITRGVDNCLLGGFYSEVGSKTTPFVWDDEQRTWVPGEPVIEWSGVLDKVRDYTDEEKVEKGCVTPTPTPTEPSPTPTEPSPTPTEPSPTPSEPSPSVTPSTPTTIGTPTASPSPQAPVPAALAQTGNDTLLYGGITGFALLILGGAALTASRVRKH